MLSLIPVGGYLLWGSRLNSLSGVNILLASTFTLKYIKATLYEHLEMLPN